MAEQYAIPIDKAEIPYRFDIEIAGELFTFEIHYNARFDFFTAALEKNGVVIVAGERITYGQPMFGALNDPRLPKIPIIPKDVAGQETRVGWDQLDETVFLFLDEATT